MNLTDSKQRLREVFEEVQSGIPHAFARLCQGRSIREAPRNGRHLREDDILGLAVDHGIALDPLHGATLPRAAKELPISATQILTAVRKAFREAYAAFVAAFREASEKLRAGDRMARFPLGSFPPGLPFVEEAVGPP